MLHRALRIEELASDVRPFDLWQLDPDQPYQALLESLGPRGALARYSFFASDPFLVFRAAGRRAFAGSPGDLRPLAGDPLTELSSLLARYGTALSTAVEGEPPVPFLGGAVGYLAYELLEVHDGVPDCDRPGLGLPDAYLLFFDTVFAFDTHENRSWVSTSGFAPTRVAAESAAAEKMATAKARVASLPSLARPPRDPDLRRRAREILASRPQLTEAHVLEAGIVPVLDRAAYLDVVRTAREHILAGDVFEICTTNRFDTKTTLSGAELYRALSTVNEAAFASYLKFPELEIISSSPERFVRLDRDRWAETRPIKGTRPRGRTTDEDERLRDELTTSEKDQAENIMIVDLARNDLGRVCEFHTISVPDLRIVETLPFTHQLVSTVRGRLRAELSSIDLVRATFPGGSMTGAPKIEAMKIIDRLEPVQRGIYSGAIGYFGFDGTLDLDIVIRTLIKTGDALSFHVGGAIVADSEPGAEYQETLDKAHGLVTALEVARHVRGRER